jgi:D-sedoheptulose 7-phosphate isomerase
MHTDPERRTMARTYLQATADTVRRAADACDDAIVAAADLIVDTFRADGKLLLCGNGGSAADCQHMATEFVSRLTKEFERPGLPLPTTAGTTACSRGRSRLSAARATS